MNPSDMPSSPRRNFLKALGGFAALPVLSSAQSGNNNTPSRPAAAKYMGGFKAPKLEKVKVAIIGVGARGGGHATQLAGIEGVDFVGICDLVEKRAKNAEARVTKRGHNPKVYFGEEEAWIKMLSETKPDAVFIATPWDHHAPMCIGAMNAGAHAFCEVPIAVTLKEMWDIVDTSEATGRHCMMMENVNYGRENFSI